LIGIDELIAFHEGRRVGAEDEIARIENLPEGRSTSHEDHDVWIADWERLRRISRDTVSYLLAVKRYAVPVASNEEQTG